MSPAGRVVYVVDDEEAVREGFCRLLRSAGLVPKGYSSPSAFLDEVIEEPGACVLLDVTMPGMTGLQVAERLMSRGLAMAVVLVTAREDPEVLDLLGSGRCRRVLRKPVDEGQLLEAIAEVATDGRAASPTGLSRSG